MTDKEMAIQYANKIAEEYRDVKSDYGGYANIKDAFLNGLKAGRQQWHYPSKGELPRFGIKVLIKVHSRDEVDVGGIFYPDAFTVSLKRWEIYTDNVDRFYSDKEILAWQYLPEPPENEDNLCDVNNAEIRS